jgi:hypothetical protein
MKLFGMLAFIASMFAGTKARVHVETARFQSLFGSSASSGSYSDTIDFREIYAAKRRNWKQSRGNSYEQ